MMLSALVKQYEKNMASYEEWKLSDFRKKYKSIEEHIKDAVWFFYQNVNENPTNYNLIKMFLKKLPNIYLIKR